jgi:hypothetical protein
MQAFKVLQFISVMLGFQVWTLAFFGLAFLVGAGELMRDRTRHERDSVEKLMPLHSKWLFAGALGITGAVLMIPSGVATISFLGWAFGWFR